MGSSARQSTATTSWSSSTTQASQGIDELSGLLRDVRQGKGTAGKLMTDGRLYNDLQQSAASAGDLTRGIRDGRGTLGKLIIDNTFASAWNGATANIQELAAKLNTECRRRHGRTVAERQAVM